MNKTKLNKLIAEARATVTLGTAAKLAIDAVVFAYKLNTGDEAQLRWATRDLAHPLRTVDDLKLWIRAHVAPESSCVSSDLRAWNEKSLDKEVLWWGACRNASSYYELRVKDIASILLEGLQPFQMVDVQCELNNVWESVESDELETHEQLENDLRDHFGLGQFKHTDSDEE